MIQGLKDYVHGPAFFWYVVFGLAGVGTLVTESLYHVLVWIIVWHVFCWGMWQMGKRM